MSNRGPVTRRAALSAIPRVSFVFVLLGVAVASYSEPMTKFEGSATGVFNAPAGGVTSGVGTNFFTWGTGDPSNLRFVGRNFTVTTPTGYIYGAAAQNSRPAFSLGTLTFYNGTIPRGTGSDGVRLDVSTGLTVPVPTGTVVVPSTLTLINTPNTADPVASADQVFLPKNLPPVVVSTVGGAKISIEPIGFANPTAGGFTSVIDRFSVLEQASASADLVAKIASPCEPIVRNGVATAIAGKTMNATFTPKFSLSMVDAAKLCGYDHFTWYQVITTDPYPPGGQVPPYIDPPVGGGPAFGGCADDLPFYWDERLCPPNAYSLSANTTANTVTYSDTPTEGRLTAGQFLAFTTSLVGVNTDNTYEILYTWSWKSNNTGGAGGVFRRTLPGDSDTGGVGGVYDVKTNLNPWQIPINIRNIWRVTGALNADIGLDLRKPGDVNADGVVTCADLAAVRAAFGARLGDARYAPEADLDNNGLIDVRDLAVVSRAVPAGTVCP